jgi:uncharacterized membrane protein
MPLSKKRSIPGGAIIKLLNYLSIAVDPNFVAAELEKHPYYPSLLSLSDVLTALKIKNEAYHVDFDELADMPVPFLAHSHANGGEFLVIKELTADHIIFANEKRNVNKLSVEEFKNIFAGVVLVAEPSSGFSAANSFKTALSVFKTATIIAGLLLIFALALYFHTDFFGNLNWQTLSLTLFKSAGLITSVLLLIQSIDSDNPLVQVLCQTKGKTNCSAILSSKAAKVFGGLRWSDVGFFYFTGTWLFFLFGDRSRLMWEILALLNFVSLPYTFYSIYYQARIAKQWCKFCCAIQALLWLEFIPLVTVYASNKGLTPAGRLDGSISALAICLLIPVILLVTLKPLFLTEQQQGPLKEQLRKFKYNTLLFHKLLAEQPRHEVPGDEWSIALGNPEADNVITMVSNPYCPPCAETHKILDEFIAQNPNLQARIVFTANNTDNDIRTPVSRHLMALNGLTDKTIIKHALNDWYEQKQQDYKEWAKVYPIKVNEADYQCLDKQKVWCQTAEITFTPTLLLNGYRLPDLYQLPDLRYMLD